MKRAEVFRDDSLHLPWVVQISAGPLTGRDVRIAERTDDTYHERTRYFLHHADALHDALAEVGLTEKNTEKETNR